MKTLVIATLLLITGACASSGTRVNEASQAISILTVQNQRPEDLTIYVMHAGYKGRRLGEVRGFTSATFVLSQFDVPTAADMQFLAMSLGDGRSELSDPVIAVRGASYQWQLAPGRGQNFALRRNTTL
jgi:hypothetical protein